MELLKRGFYGCLLVALPILGLFCESAAACTRILYETGTGTYITGRSMDWSDVKAQTDFWAFPKGMKRDGGVGAGSITWTSKYGSVKASKKFKDRLASVAAVFSQMRAIGVPYGMTHPDLPNISSTLWRTVFDHDAKRYYFDSAVNPSVIWVDLDKLNLNSGAKPMKLRLGVPGDGLARDVSSKLKPTEPFKFLVPPLQE